MPKTETTARVDLGQFLGQNATSGTLGANAYQRALNYGLNPQQISNAAARQGYAIGAGVQQQQQPQRAQQSGNQKFDRNAGLGANLRNIGPVLSPSELKKIARITGKSQDQVIKKAVDLGIALGSKVVNQYKTDTKFFPESVSVTKNGITQTFDPFRGDPVLAAIKNAQQNKLKKGSKLFIGTQGGPGTVLPRPALGPAMGGGMTMSTPQPTAPAPTPQPTVPQQTIPQQTAPDLGIQEFLNQLLNTEPLQEPAFPTFDAFETLNSDFDIPDPLQFASLGQSYLTDAILAARRRQQSRRDYMRNMMMMAGFMPNMSNLAIGGGVNVG